MAVLIRSIHWWCCWSFRTTRISTWCWSSWLEEKCSHILGELADLGKLICILVDALKLIIVILFEKIFKKIFRLMKIVLQICLLHLFECDIYALLLQRKTWTM